MFSGFGVPITPATLAQVNAAGTPSAGDGSEVIFHQFFDTQPYVSATTTKLSFFTQNQNDNTLSNLETPSALPAPQSFQIYDVTLDILEGVPVTLMTAVGVLTTVGVLTDMATLLLGSPNRPVWSLFISNKEYGPYSLTTLHGTGGPEGIGYGSSIATSSGSIQYARNAIQGGWNYWGNIIIKERANFKFVLAWAAAATLGSTDTRFRVSMFGILNRAVQ